MVLLLIRKWRYRFNTEHFTAEVGSEYPLGLVSYEHNLQFLVRIDGGELYNSCLFTGINYFRASFISLHLYIFPFDLLVYLENEIASLSAAVVNVNPIVGLIQERDVIGEIEQSWLEIEEGHDTRLKYDKHSPDCRRYERIHDNICETRLHAFLCCGPIWGHVRTGRKSDDGLTEILFRIDESSNPTEQSCPTRQWSKEELRQIMLRVRKDNPDWKPTWEAAPPPRKENPGWEAIRRINRERIADRAKKEFEEMSSKSTDEDECEAAGFSDVGGAD